ncbi:hypothetical protein [Klebsiella phage KP-PHA-Meh]|uniref:Nucleotide kinase n=1 Tax=Klebsiella phage KA TaxID=3109000 RepID=A0ABZ1A111_9CAUD|nr:hypothetical protein [Klebsiella phage KA]WQZ03107.1 hypothetical protein [Klebsiella phage KP-PHA-Meh]
MIKPTKFHVGDLVVRKASHVGGVWADICEQLQVGLDSPRLVTCAEDGLITLAECGTSWRAEFFQLFHSKSGAVLDSVNSPRHYQFFPDLEAIEVIARSMTQEQFYGYCLGNRLKYRLRAGNKDKLEQDIAKSDKYLELYEQHRGKCIAA